MSEDLFYPEQIRAFEDLPNALQKISTLNSENVLAVKNYLMTEWAPVDDTEAVIMKNVQHIFKAADKHISKMCGEQLDNCEFCDRVRVDSLTGLKVLRKNKPETKTYNITQETAALEQEIQELDYKMNELMQPYKDKVKELKEKLEDAKLRAGFNVQHNGYTYTVKF